MKKLKATIYNEVVKSIMFANTIALECYVAACGTKSIWDDYIILMVICS